MSDSERSSKRSKDDQSSSERVLGPIAALRHQVSLHMTELDIVTTDNKVELLLTITALSRATIVDYNTRRTQYLAPHGIPAHRDPFTHAIASFVSDSSSTRVVNKDREWKIWLYADVRDSSCAHVFWLGEARLAWFPQRYLHQPPYLYLSSNYSTFTVPTEPRHLVLIEASWHLFVAAVPHLKVAAISNVLSALASFLTKITADHLGLAWLDAIVSQDKSSASRIEMLLCAHRTALRFTTPAIMAYLKCVVSKLGREEVFSTIAEIASIDVGSQVLESVGELNPIMYSQLSKPYYPSGNSTKYESTKVRDLKDCDEVAVTAGSSASLWANITRDTQVIVIPPGSGLFVAKNNAGTKRAAITPVVTTPARFIKQWAAHTSTTNLIPAYIDVLPSCQVAEEDVSDTDI